MTKVKDLRKRFPNTFKAIDEMLLDNCCGMVHPHYDVPEVYIDIIEDAEPVFTDLVGKTLGDVVSLDNVKGYDFTDCGDYLTYALEDYAAFKNDDATGHFVAGEATFIELITSHYGDEGGIAGDLLAQVFDGELSGMSVMR